MDLTREIIRQIQSEQATVVDIVHVVSEIFEDREIPRAERARIWERAEKYIRMAWITNPQIAGSFPHAMEAGDLSKAAKADDTVRPQYKMGPVASMFSPEPRPEASDDHGESDDINLIKQYDPELERLLDEEEEIERQEEQRRLDIERCLYEEE